MAGLDGTALTPDVAARLQRTVGNRATADLVSRRTDDPVRPSPRDGATGLPEPLRANLEALSGFSMGDVRVHYNSPRPARVSASAFTKGSDIHLGRGHEEHLPHEAWHVVQQKRGRVVPTVTTREGGLNDDPRLEAEATRMGAVAARPRPPVDRRLIEAPAPGNTMQPMLHGLSSIAELLGVEAGIEAVAEALGFSPWVVRLAAGSTALATLYAWYRSGPPTPSWTFAGEGLEGASGYFERSRRWSVETTVPGVIVQEVTRRFDVYRMHDGKRLEGAELDAYVRVEGSTVHASDTHYWELWAVDDSGTVSDGGVDTFGLCSIIPEAPGDDWHAAVTGKTEGEFTITGTARFYPIEPPDLFVAGSVGAAGELRATTTDPTSVLGSARSWPTTYSVMATWDGVNPDTDVL